MLEVCWPAAHPETFDRNKGKFAMVRTWVYDPHSGGVPIPNAVQVRVRSRILAHAKKKYAGKYIWRDRIGHTFTELGLITDTEKGLQALEAAARIV